MKISGRRHYSAALAAGAAACALAFTGGVALAVANITITNVTGPDHERLVFTLSPGGSQVFKVPATNDPVRIYLDKVSTNGGVQSPSEVFGALINVDGNGAGMSWIGTNSDGTQFAGTSVRGSDITNLMCGPSCTIASLDLSSVAGHTVVLKTNAATSSIKEKYVVNIWY